MIELLKEIKEATDKQIGLEAKIDYLMSNWVCNNVMAMLILQGQIKEVFEEAKKNASESEYCNFDVFFTHMAEPTISATIEAQKDLMLHMLLKETLK